MDEICLTDVFPKQRTSLLIHTDSKYKTIRRNIWSNRTKATCQSISQSPTDLESTQSDSQSPTDLESTQSQNIGNARTKCLYVHEMPIRK